MDIKFIWIKEHQLLKNFNFNFCHDGLHEFQYENDGIVIHSKQEYPIAFGKNITNITGIAGKNGSGKSSFCEVVLESIATYRDGSFGFYRGFNGIVCFGDHFFIKNEIKVANEEDLAALGYQIVRYNESPFEEMKHEWRSSFAKIRFIYYSNFLDRKSGQWVNNLYNISTQNYLLYDKIYSTYPIYNLQSGNSIDHKKVDKYTEYETHVVQEDFRNLRFITKFPNFVPFFGEHTFVNLHSSYSGNNRFLNPNETSTNVNEQLSELESDIFNEVYPNFHVQIEKTSSVKQTITVNQEAHKALIVKLYKLNILKTKYNAEMRQMDRKIINKFIYEGEVPNYLQNNNIEELIETHRKLLEHGQMMHEFQPDIIENRHKQTKDWRFYIIENVNIPLDKITIPLFEKLINLEDKILNTDQISFKRISNYTIYPHLSSGQSSYLSLFSRLYDIILRNEHIYKDSENLILFLDEAEVGFHPEWSRNFLKRLTDFLNLDFIRYKFQIILTTHNPYILSDLPSKNVKLFYQNGSSSPTVNKPKSETFGANIYDLLADSFFLENGFIGEFAKEKIDNIFNDLTSHLQGKINISNTRRDEIYQIITIVGEPLIKRQLSRLFDQVFRTEIELKVIDEQIEKLNQVKSRIQKRNDSN